MIRIIHLYPKEMNIYGDNGNIITLVRRCEWRNIKAEVYHHQIGDKLTIRKSDIIFMGGGQDSGQQLVASDILRNKTQLTDAVQNGNPILVICGAYQLFGKYFKDYQGNKLEGLAIFDAFTIAKKERLIGNIVVDSKRFGKLVGFENHSGRTYLGDAAIELGVVVKGGGNNGEDGGEGAIRHNCVGSYLHGSFLPKNPQVADWLISTSLKQNGDFTELIHLDDKLEIEASKIAENLE